MLMPFKKLIPFEIVLSSHWCGQKFLSKQTSEHFSWKSKYILTPPYCSPCSTSARLSPYQLDKELRCLWLIKNWIILSSCNVNYSGFINHELFKFNQFLYASSRYLFVMECKEMDEIISLKPRVRRVYAPPRPPARPATSVPTPTPARTHTPAPTPARLTSPAGTGVQQLWFFLLIICNSSWWGRKLSHWAWQSWHQEDMRDHPTEGGNKTQRRDGGIRSWGGGALPVIFWVWSGIWNG